MVSWTCEPGDGPRRREPVNAGVAGLGMVEGDPHVIVITAVYAVLVCDVSAQHVWLGENFAPKLFVLQPVFERRLVGMFVHGVSLSGEAHGVVKRGAIWFCLFNEMGSRKRCSSSDPRRGRGSSAISIVVREPQTYTHSWARVMAVYTSSQVASGLVSIGRTTTTCLNSLPCER